jgi:hypothetical protein
MRTLLLLTCHPMRLSAARMRDALVAGQLLTQDRERYVQRRCGQFSMPNAIGYHFDCQLPGVTDCFFARFSVGHYAGKLEGFSDPPSIVFAIKLYGNTHMISIAPWGLGAASG